MKFPFIIFQVVLFCLNSGFIFSDLKAEDKRSEKIKILECIEVDFVPADFPVSFSFLTSGEWQFIAYYNKNREMTMASRKTSEQK